MDFNKLKQTHNTMTVRIVKVSNPEIWYADEIGNAFEVFENYTDNDMFILSWLIENTVHYIHVNDCDLV